MSKTILIDGETLETKGSVRLNPITIKKLYHIIISLMIALFFSIALCVSQTYNLNRAIKSYEKELLCVTDSLNNVIDSVSTESEIKILHSEIGRLSITKHDYSRPSEKDVYDFAKGIGAWYPEIITAQAIIESGCGKRIPEKSNNLFGMKVPGKRETTAHNRGSGDVYAKYGSWKLCVADRILWELNRYGNHKPSYEEYLEGFSTYAEDENYLNKITSTAENIRKKLSKN